MLHKIISSIFLTIGLLAFIFDKLININLNIDENKVQNQIEDTFVKDKIPVNVKTEEKEDIKNKSNNDILGYIEIPKINLKKVIKVGDVDKILNQKYVAIINGKTIQSKNIVLAGHNIESVFRNIRNLEINDDIIVYFENETRYYKVGKVKTIEANDTQYLRETKEKTLTLITCTDNNTKRLLVICYMI